MISGGVCNHLCASGGINSTTNQSSISIFNPSAGSPLTINHLYGVNGAAVETIQYHFESNPAGYTIGDFTAGVLSADAESGNVSGDVSVSGQLPEHSYTGYRLMGNLDLSAATGSITEGSGALADELVAFAGLDALDLKNYYLVANYIACLKKCGLLAEVVPAQQ